MRVDVHLGDSELALLAGYNRSTTMGIKKPGELQRELLSDMENIEEKRMLTVPEVKSGFPEAVSEAHEVSEESGSNVAGGIRADLLSKLSELAPVEDNSDETGSDVLSKDGEGGAPSESEESEESVGVLPDDEEDAWEEGDSTLPDDEEDWEEGNGTLPDDEEDWEEGGAVTLSADEDSVEEEPETFSDDGTFSESVVSEEDTTGISSDDGYSDELPENDEDEVEASKGISASAQEVNESASSRVAISDVVEKPAPSLHRSREPMPKHTTSHPTGYSAPPVSLYDFILNNGGSMLIEDVRKCYPIDEVKKALNLGKIYRFGNKVGV